MTTTDIDFEPSPKMQALTALLLRLAENSNATEEVFKIADALRADLTPEEIAFVSLVFLEDPDFKQLFEAGDIDLIKKPYELDKLSQLPANTFGGRFARHMTDRGLTPEFFPHLEITNAMAFLAMRIRKTHDVWHVLAGFDTDVAGEAGLMGFYQAQYPSTFPMAIITAVLLGMIEKRDLAEAAKVMEQISAGYTNGKRARSLYGVRWEDHWERNLTELRQEYLIEPYIAA